MPQYQIIPSHPEAHIFTVTLKIDHPDPTGQVLSLPAWIRGSYMIRDFSKNIVTIEASCQGKTVGLRELDKQTWQADAVDGVLLVEYQVYAWDLSVRGAHLDQTHGYFNGTSVFLKVHGQENALHAVTMLKPEGDGYESWKLACTLEELEADGQGFGLYTAVDYETLIDHPVEMGNYQLSSFEAVSCTHEMVYTGRVDTDLDAISQDVKAICEQHIGMFGELPAMHKYQFQTLVVGDGYGGLEHKTSTSLMCKREDLQLQENGKMTEGYRQFLGLCSHEYFHLWNVKRITPANFQASDLSSEAYSHLLWAFEGITSYYDDLGVLRAGCISVESYLQMLAQLITRVLRISGRHKQTLEASSFYTWNKFYKQDENAPNAIVSYYAKGALVALLLDLQIRLDSAGEKSLDDVMRYLWQEFGKKDIGVPEDGIEAAVMTVTGQNYAGWFDRMIRSTEELPLSDMLAEFGITCRFRARSSEQEKGGDPKAKDQDFYSLGANVSFNAEGIKISHVFDHGAAQAAGLSAGDVLIAVNYLKANESNWKLCVSKQDKPIICHVFRRDELFETQVVLQPAAKDTCDLWVDDEVSEVIKTRRDSWLHQ